jgi:quercetin dioxygenase-like cupin family protein
MQLLENLEYHENNPYSQPVYVARDGRILRFTLRPGQEVKEHEAPHSPVYIVVLQGHGVFAGGDSKEATFGPNDLLIFEAGEPHSIRALAEELVFVVFLHGAPDTGGFKSRLLSQRDERDA